MSCLSVHKMNQLSISNRIDMLNLQMACCTYGSKKPKRECLGFGAPGFNIPKSVLENHLEEGFKIRRIASMLSVSESTVYRRMQTYTCSLSSVAFSDLSGDELDRHLTELSKEFSFCGEGMITFF